MAKTYTKLNWQNSPSTSTAISATNLNIMDKGIDDIDNAVVALQSGKIDKTSIAQTDTINDATKVASTAITHAHGLEIDAINDNLAFLTENLDSTYFDGSTVYKSATWKRLKVWNAVKSALNASTVYTIHTITNTALRPTGNYVKVLPITSTGILAILQINTTGTVLITPLSAIAIGATVMINEAYY